jgi:hypothetical protein
MPFFIRWPMQGYLTSAPVHEGHASATSFGQVFWLPDRPTCRAFPSENRTVATQRRSSPVTAAGPQRSYTVFPVKLLSEHPAQNIRSPDGIVRE